MRPTLSQFFYRLSQLLLVLGILFTCLWLRSAFAGGDELWSAFGFVILATPVLAAALFLGVLPGLLLYLQTGERRELKTLLFSGITFLLLSVQILLSLRLPPVLVMAAGANGEAGTWENDPKNWERAFQTNAPPEVTVVNSKYWRSNHFTYEYIWFFEIKTTPAWRDQFLHQRNLQPVSESQARSFRDNNKSAITPDWFAPDPVELYDVWSGTHGTLWINKTNGHIHFYGVLL